MIQGITRKQNKGENAANKICNAEVQIISGFIIGKMTDGVAKSLEKESSLLPTS